MRANQTVCFWFILLSPGGLGEACSLKSGRLSRSETGIEFVQGRVGILLVDFGLATS